MFEVIRLVFLYTKLHCSDHNTICVFADECFD